MPSYVEPGWAAAAPSKLFLYWMLCAKSAQTIQLVGQAYLIRSGSSCSRFWHRLAGRNSSTSMRQHKLCSRAVSALGCILSQRHNFIQVCKDCPRPGLWSGTEPWRSIADSVTHRRDSLRAALLKLVSVPTALLLGLEQQMYIRRWTDGEASLAQPLAHNVLDNSESWEQ